MKIVIYFNHDVIQDGSVEEEGELDSFNDAVETLFGEGATIDWRDEREVWITIEAKYYPQLNELIIK